GGYFIDPSRWSGHAAAMTSTHDLPTVAGWWQGIDLQWREQLGRLPDAAREQAEREQDRRALWAAFNHAGISSGEPPPPSRPEPVVDAALAFVASAPAPLAFVAMEDLLGLEQQPNLPATIDEHPNWRRRLPEGAPQLLQREPVRRRMEILRGIRPPPVGE